jgi:hypothetical protein
MPKNRLENSETNDTRYFVTDAITNHPKRSIPLDNAAQELANIIVHDYKHKNQVNATEIAVVDSIEEMVDEIEAQNQELPSLASNETIDEMIAKGYYRDMFSQKAVEESVNGVKSLDPYSKQHATDSADEPYRSGTGFGVFKNK